MAPGSEIGKATRRSLGFGCFFFDADLDGLLDLLVVNGHIDPTRCPTRSTPSRPTFSSIARGKFREVAAEVGREFAQPKVGRGAAFGDFDNDGDLDVLITTNGGPAYLYRNDLLRPNKSLRFKLEGVKSNRDGSAPWSRSTRRPAELAHGEERRQLPLAVRTARDLWPGPGDAAERVVVYWPSGQTDEFKNVKAGRYRIVEGKGISAG